MKLYTVHLKPDMASSFESTEFVPEGFQVFGFGFNIFWLLAKGLWRPFFALLVCLVSIVVVVDMFGLSEIYILLAEVVIGFIIGCEGGDWQRAALKRRGYIMSDVVSGDSLLAAEQRFFERHIASISSVRPLHI